MSQYLKTSDIAREIGVHPNTVRLYEERGYISPIPRAENGYRLFTTRHLEQMRLAHLALTWPYPGGVEPARELVICAAEGELGMALELAYEYLANARTERTRAEAAAEFLEQWARGQALDTPGDNEDIQTIADRWLTTLARQEKRAQAIIHQIVRMIDAALEPSQ